MSVEIKEGWFSPDSSARLYTKTWIPPSGTDIRARLVFVHGFSDHCNAYYHLFPDLATRGILVYAFDQRGWGRSAPEKGQRGNSGPTSTVLADISSFLNHINASSIPSTTGQASATALFLMGHSMGGAEVLLLSLLHSHPQPLPRISGILLEAPYIAVHPASQPNALKVMVGRLAAKVLPKYQLVQKVDPKTMSRSQQVCRDWETDELCHDTGTLECLVGMMQRAADLTMLAEGQTVQGLGLKTVMGLGEDGSDSVPVWIGHGTGDLVTDHLASRAMSNKLDVKDKSIKLYQGAYHKLHAEPDGVAEEFASDVASWILERSSLGREELGEISGVRSKL